MIWPEEGYWEAEENADAVAEYDMEKRAYERHAEGEEYERGTCD